jgi:DHA2 family multidrug resistance protein
MVSALALWQMQHFDLVMGETPILTSGFFQGFGLGVMMVPVTTAAFTSLPAELRAEGSALFAIFRNMGSSVGISLMQALLVHNTQTVHASLAEHYDPSDPVMRAQLPQIFIPGSAQGPLALDAELGRQASMVAYVDDFKLMFFMCFACMLLLLLIRNPRQETVHAVSR